MSKPFSLFALGTLLAFFSSTGIAKAQLDGTIGVDFALPPVQTDASERSASQRSPSPIKEPIVAESTEPLATSTSQISIEEINYPQESLPPLQAAAYQRLSSLETYEDPLIETSPVGIRFEASDIQLSAASDAVDASSEPSALAFETTPQLNSEVLTSAEVTYDVANTKDWIFAHGTNSLVARAVGSAEGTRRSDGGHTYAYYGHVDPGNGVWNLGTFSYQHSASSPEEADERQLTRLQRQGRQLEEKAQAHNITLSLKEKLNGLDLANQAPLAALDREGYIDYLAKAKQLLMPEDEGILYARTHAYLDPDTRQWNAPGLGNNIHSISKDQERRMAAIALAMNSYPVDSNSIELASLGEVEIGQNTLDSITDPLVASSEPTSAHKLSLQSHRIQETFSQIIREEEVSFILPPVGTSAISDQISSIEDSKLADRSEESPVAIQSSADYSLEVSQDKIIAASLDSDTAAEALASDENTSAATAIETAAVDFRAHNIKLEQTKAQKQPILDTQRESIQHRSQLAEDLTPALTERDRQPVTPSTPHLEESANQTLSRLLSRIEQPAETTETAEQSAQQMSSSSQNH